MSESEKATDGWLLGDVGRKEPGVKAPGAGARGGGAGEEAEGCVTAVDAALCPRPPRLQRTV